MSISLSPSARYINLSISRCHPRSLCPPGGRLRNRNRENQPLSGDQTHLRQRQILHAVVEQEAIRVSYKSAGKKRYSTEQIGHETANIGGLF